MIVEPFDAALEGTLLSLWFGRSATAGTLVESA
jgi:hypothetical protein